MVQIDEHYRPRLIDAKIESLLNAFGAISIEGPKYCGKTWTSMKHAKSVFALDSIENNYGNLRLARLDPTITLDGEHPHLIDEWQQCPAIWDGVRRFVDMNPGTGHFILCGSSTPEHKADELGTSPLHSGFGRIGTVRMRTMSLYESGDSSGTVSLNDLFNGKIRTTTSDNVSLRTIVGLIMSGGWPGNIDKPLENRIQSVELYISQICNNDLPRVDSSKNSHRMMMLLRSLARNESTMASDSKIASDIREYDDDVIKDSTVSNYIAVLNRMNLIENQPAFNPNLRSSVRVGKTPKRHLTDQSLSVAALNASEEMLMNDLNTLGFLFESMCERDLQIYAAVNSGRLYHYRDGRGNEIDAVVEMKDGRWGAFEIKLGTNQIDSAADELLYIDNMIRNDPKGKAPEFLCVITGMGSAAYRREDGVYVIPITMLRN